MAAKLLQNTHRHWQLPWWKLLLHFPMIEKALMFCWLGKSLPCPKNRSSFHYSRFNSAPSHLLCHLRRAAESLYKKQRTQFCKVLRWIGERRRRAIQGQADKPAGQQTMTRWGLKAWKCGPVVKTFAQMLNFHFRNSRRLWPPNKKQKKSDSFLSAFWYLQIKKGIDAFKVHYCHSSAEQIT